MNCPHCAKEFAINFSAAIPNEQTFGLSLKSDGELVGAEAVGSAIVNIVKVYTSIAENMGTSVSVFIQSITVQSGEVSIRFLCCENKKPSGTQPTTSNKEGE